ncbi:MAG: SDR family oxidoreductase [Hyphomicrobiaceae bacterium]
MNRLFCFGFGYSARTLAQSLLAAGWHVAGTSRSQAGATAIASCGVTAYQFHGPELTADLRQELASSTHILVSIPPDADGDVVLQHCRPHLVENTDIRWVGYLSSISVYGDHGGVWIDETASTQPRSSRGIARLAAENAWTAFARQQCVHLQTFRLAGIYGPGRSAIDAVKSGRARRLIKPGQVFNRIHVADIAAIVTAGIERPQRNGIYNVADDEPAAPQDVIAYAADLLDLPPLPDIPFDAADLSPMARSFYSEVKRVNNAKIKRDLGVQLRYPTYREGLTAIAQDL